MTPPFALPPFDFPLPAYVRRVESGLLVPRQAVLPGLYIPPGLMAKKLPIVFEYLGSFTDPANKVTYTAPNCVLGAESSDRLVIVGAVGNENSSQHVSSVTIAGAAATIHINPSGHWTPTVLASRVVPTGATADISVTFIRQVDRFILFWATLKNYRSVLPISTDGFNSGTAGPSSTATLNVRAGGVAVYVAGITPDTASTNMTWSNATELADLGTDTHLRASFAVHYVQFDQSGMTATVSSGKNSYRGISGASWW